MKKIVIITGSETRHIFFRKYISLSNKIFTINSYCESQDRDLNCIVNKDRSYNKDRLQHLASRKRSEEDFYGVFIESTEDCSNPVLLPKGEINNTNYTKAIIDSNPDLLIAYGCSIIKEPLLSAFEGRFINVHLGLSPYYRGSGTNYWPLVNGEPEYVGATFMHIDAGIDTGDIIHQIRARYFGGDTPLQIGNRLIIDMARVFRQLIIQFDLLKKLPQPVEIASPKFYKKSMFTEDSVNSLYQNFDEGLIDNYLNDEADRCAVVPILVNPVLDI